MPHSGFSPEALLDPERLAAIRRYHLLYAAGDESFDRLTRLTSRMLDVPVAVVTVVDQDRQVLASCVGLPAPEAGPHEVPLSHSFCKHSVASGEPLVIEDAREHPLVRDSPSVGEMQVIAYAGIPLVTSEGHVLGSFCAIDHRPRRWSDLHLEFLTEMAATVMAEIEARAENAERRRIEALLAAEQEVLERISRTEPLEEVLGALVQVIEAQTDGGLGSVLLLDPESRTLRLGVAPRLPEAYNRAIQGLPVGEGFGSCGTAAHRNQAVIVSSISDDPLWRDYRALASEHDLAACWSHPIRGRDGSVLGTFAIYSRVTREPSLHEQLIVERAAHLAAVAIERHQAESALRLAKEQQDAVLSHMPSAAWLKDRDGRYLTVNRLGAAAFGRPTEQLVGRTDFDLFPAEVARAFLAEDQRAMVEGRVHVGEREIADLKESRTWDIVKVAYLDRAGEVAGTAGIAHDVTERARARNALRESEERLSLALEGAQQGLWDWNLETDHLHLNAQWQRMLGYEPGEVEPHLRSWERAVHPEDLPAVMEVLHAHLRGETPLYETEHRMCHREGHSIWVLERGRVLGRDSEGRPLRMTGTLTDITRRKQTEQALRESQRMLSMLMDNLPGMAYRCRNDPDWSMELVSRHCLDLTGYTREELTADAAPTFGELIHPEDRTWAWPAVQAALARRQPYQFNYRIRTREGVEKWVWEQGQGVFDDSGAVQALEGLVLDITERKRAEDSLVESEERFRQIAENIREAFWLVEFDPDSVASNRMLYVSPAYREIWGRSCESLLDDPLSGMADVHPEDHDRLLAEFMRTTHGANGQAEYRITRPDGDVRWLLTRFFPIPDAGGNTYRVAGVTDDVTERVQAEAERAAAEAHYRRLVENAPYAVYALDRQGRFVELNQAGAELVGRDPAEMMGRSFSRVIVPEDLPIAADALRQKLAGEVESTDVEFRLVHASGAHRLVHARATAIREDGEITGTHGIVRDITEERARQEEMRLLAAALEGLDEGVTISRFDGQIVYANAMHGRLLGYDRGSTQLPNIRQFLSEEGLRRMEKILRTVAETGVWSGRGEARRLDTGQLIPLEVTIGRVDHPGGESLLFTIARDISEEIERERQLRRVERLASVGTLIGGVAHELNNPLHAIRSFAELMQLDERDEDDRESLEIIQREADRAAKVVSDLRLIARDTQEEASRRTAVDLNDVVRHVLKVRRYALETGNVEVREDLAEGLPPVLVNRGEIEQVVLNLVVNAEQALMEEHAGKRRLTLRTRRTPAGASVHVVDSGPGIAPQHLDRIFDPFFTTKSPGEGTGLGLSLVHSIVTEHGGDIHVDSERGKGTAVRVNLPRVPSELGAFPESGARAAVVPSRSLRILVVDDEAAIRRVSVRFLERLGHSVHAAADGREALRRLEEGEYDVILSDLRMPGLDGEELLARLRLLDRGLERRLIFMTGDAASARAARVLTDAGVPVLVKPVRLEDLVNAIERLG